MSTKSKVGRALTTGGTAALAGLATGNPFIAAGAGLAGLGLGWFSGEGDEDAQANALAAQKSAADDARAYNNSVLDRQEKLNKPFLDIGAENAKRLSDLAGNGGLDYKPDTFAEAQPGAYQDTDKAPDAYKTPDFNFQADPGFQYRNDMAQKAIESSAAARGAGLNTGTLSALAQKAGQMSSDEYDRAYGRFADQRNFGYGMHQDDLNQYNKNRAFNYGKFSDTLNQYNNNRNYFDKGQDRKLNNLQFKSNTLMNLAGLGTNANTQLGQAYQGAAKNYADTTIGLANAQAAGILGQNNSDNQYTNSLLQLGGQILPYAFKSKTPPATPAKP